MVITCTVGATVLRDKALLYKSMSQSFRYEGYSLCRYSESMKMRISLIVMTVVRRPWAQRA